MARTILAIAQEAAERDATCPAPAALFNSNNRIARIMRNAAKDTFREYLRRTNWIGLSEVQSTWVWSLQPGKYAYPLPPDFLRIIPRTEQRNGWPLGLVGPTSPQAWAAWIYGGQAVSAPTGWRIRNNVIWVEPTPQAAELVVIEYISRYPVVSEIRSGDFNLSTKPLQTFAPVVPRDGWITLPDDTLLQEAIAAAAEYEGDPGYDEAVYAKEPEEILKRLLPTSAVSPLPQVRREEFTADTDKPAFEDDYLLSLGMTWRARRALGMPYAEHAAEYEEEMEVKAATDAGGSRGFRLGSEGRVMDGQVPLGGGRWLVD